MSAKVVQRTYEYTTPYHAVQQISVFRHADSRVDLQVVGQECGDRNPGARSNGAAWVARHDDVSARAVLAGTFEVEWRECHIHATQIREVEEERIETMDLSRLRLDCQRPRRSAGW